MPPVGFFSVDSPGIAVDKTAAIAKLRDMDVYLLLKALHVVAVICWFAGLFYLPRLFVYHAEHQQQTPCVQMLRVMERKLYRYIMTPALWLTLATGAGLVVMNLGWLSMGWLHAKLMLVLALVAYHFSLGYWQRRLAQRGPHPQGTFFRWYNEIPTALLLVIVWLAVTKPF